MDRSHLAAASGRTVLALLLSLLIPGVAFPQAVKATPEDAVLEVRGYLVPAQTVQIVSEVSGQVVAVHFEEGAVVKKGEVLARIDPTRYELNAKRTQALVERARARLEERKNGPRPDEIKQAEAELRLAEAERDLARNMVERLRQLHQRGAASAEELAKAEKELRQAEAKLAQAQTALRSLQAGTRPEQVQAAQAELAAAEAEHHLARWWLDRTILRAPIDGTVLRKSVAQGGHVSAEAPPGSAGVCVIADLTRLEVDVSVLERDAGRVSVGQRCEVRAEAFPDTVYRGKVARILPVADRARGCIVVRVLLEGIPGDGKLRPEMSARVRFLAAPLP